MLRHLFALLLVSVLPPGVTSACAEELNVILVTSDTSPPYQQFSQALDKVIDKHDAKIRLTVAQAGTSVHGDLVVAVGMKATELALADFDAPVLGVMIHKTSYEGLIEKTAIQKRPGEISAIYLNQPWERQLEFIQAALPNRRKIGLLHSPDTHLELFSLRENFTVRGLTLVAQAVRSNDLLFYTLDELLSKTDVLLSIPDNAIYNGSNARNILLTSYRHKVPLIGISQGYVNAGALGAIFSTPEQLAEQTGAALVYFSRNKRLPEPQYPATYSIALNHQVARSLGIALSSPEEIRERMNKAGGGKR